MYRIQSSKSFVIPWKYFKFVDAIFCIGQTLISKWMRPAPFIGHRQTHSEIVALRGGTQCLWSCYQIPNARTGTMIRSGIVKENMKPSFRRQYKTKIV